jgi:tRNA pseudouridine32 synthase/23S rRNA pseudouridine746 synthase
LFIIKPITGKTHQIRVVLKSLGSSIAGDPLYNKKDKDSDRGYLHSYCLIFTLFHKEYKYLALPENGHFFKFDKFLDVFKKYEKPYELVWPKYN